MVFIEYGHKHLSWCGRELQGAQFFLSGEEPVDSQGDANGWMSLGPEHVGDPIIPTTAHDASNVRQCV